MLPLEKQCSKCNQTLPAEMFHKNKKNNDGLDHRCKHCVQAYAQRNPLLKQTADMFGNARRRAKKKNVPFDIDLPYIRSITPSHCPILGFPLEWSARREDKIGALPNSPSLDRIVPERGYVKGNVWIISHKANSIKNSATHEELKLVTKAVGEAIVNSLDF